MKPGATPSASRAREAGRQRSLRRAVLLAGSLFVLLMFAATLFMSWRDRENDIAQWKVSLSDFTVVLSAHALQTIKSADLVLLSIVDRIGELGIEDEKTLHEMMGSRAMFEMLRDKSGGVPQIDVATIVADNGDVINFTRSYPPPPINLADRDYFRAHFSDPDLKLYLSEPVKNRGNGAWTFYLARKIKNSKGETLGLVLTGISVDFFQNFYKSVNISPDSAIALFRNDGTLLAHYPKVESFIGKSFSQGTTFHLLLNGAESGAVVSTSPRTTNPDDARMRIRAARRVMEYPLAVSASAAEDLVLAGWRRMTFFIGSSTIGLAVVMAGIMTWILSLLARQQRTMEQLEQSRVAAETANRAKSEFLANVSHELRTPLNAIIGFSEIIRDQLYGPLANANYASYINNIHESGVHLLTIIGNILDLTKAEAGHLSLQDELIDVCDVAARCITIIRPTADRKQLTVRIDRPMQPVTLMADHAKFRQILINLLSNAVKFTPEKGAVSVKIRRGDDGSVIVAVSDTGIGMTAAQIPIALEPFGQIESSLSRKYEGTGLGLPLAKRLVVLHGGTLDIASVPNLGTTVTVVFPAIRLGADYDNLVAF